MSYLEGHKGSGIKVGDRVRVIKTSTSFFGDWNNSWDTRMNETVGGVYTVTEDMGDSGFELDYKDNEGGSRYAFPYDCLQKVEHFYLITYQTFDVIQGVPVYALKNMVIQVHPIDWLIATYPGCLVSWWEISYEQAVKLCPFLVVVPSLVVPDSHTRPRE